jgi:hypothetical protein
MPDRAPLEAVARTRLVEHAGRIDRKLGDRRRGVEQL